MADPKITREFVLLELSRLRSATRDDIQEDEVTSTIIQEKLGMSERSALRFLKSLVKNGTMSVRKSVVQGHVCNIYRYLKARSCDEPEF